MTQWSENALPGSQGLGATEAKSEKRSEVTQHAGCAASGGQSTGKRSTHLLMSVAGASTCQQMISCGFTWKTGAQAKQMVGTPCANCGIKYEHGGHGCVVVMQHCENASESAVVTAGMPTQGVTGSTLSASTLASKVHEHETH